MTIRGLHHMMETTVHRLVMSLSSTSIISSSVTSMLNLSSTSNNHQSYVHTMAIRGLHRMIETTVHHLVMSFSSTSSTSIPTSKTSPRVPLASNGPLQQSHGRHQGRKSHTCAQIDHPCELWATSGLFSSTTTTSIFSSSVYCFLFSKSWSPQ